MQGDGIPRISKLDVDNYLHWSIEIEHVLRLKGCWDAVAPVAGVGIEGVQAGDMVEDALSADREQRALSTMALTVKPHHLATFRLHSTARGVWEALERDFRSRGPAQMLNLRRELANLRMAKDESILRYFNRGKTLAWEIFSLGDPADDAHLVTSLLIGLPKKYELTATVLSAQPELTVQRAQEQLQAAEARLVLDARAHDGPRAKDKGNALAAADGGRKGRRGDRGQPYKRRDARCYGCNKMGHIRRNCPEEGKKDDDGGEGAAGLAMMASGAKPPNGMWILDSGATHHMTGSRATVSNVMVCDPVEITLADGRVCMAQEAGRARLMIQGDKGPTSLMLNHVLVVPGLASNLFFIRKASSHGYHVEFHANHALVKKGGKVHVRGEVNGKLYVLSTPTTTGAAMIAASRTKEETWHRRFAHLGATTMASTAAAVKGMDITPGGMAELRQKTCGPCIEGKMTRAPFPSSESRTTAPLQFLHTEVCGPMRVVSSGGNAYFVTIIDNETKYKAFTPIRTKGKAKQAVIATVNRWETLTGLNVKVIRSDNGKEYEGTDFERWLSDKGIQHQTSVPYTPQQNGVAERYNRVITERTMALQADSGLPPKWWAEAGATVSYLANRVPQRNQHLTPYELLHGVKPDVGHICIFGCAEWVYTPHDIRTKLQPRAERGILLGYAENQKGYRVLVKNKVEVSRDVRFDKTVSGRSPDKMRIDQARHEPDWRDIDKAVKTEVDAPWAQGTWKLTDLPHGKRITDTETLCERKRGPIGEVTRHMGRYVVRGDKQIFLLDYIDVWAPLARYATLRTLLAFCAGTGLVIALLDIETAFLNGHIEEEIYVR
eukprot:contig_22006_g5428